MTLDISPQHLFKIQRLLSMVEGTYNYTHSQERRKRGFFNDTQDSIRFLIEYGVTNYLSDNFASVRSDLRLDDIDLFELVNTKPSLIQEALDAYKSDKDEQLYLSLLDKPTGEMTGYEYSILAGRILMSNRRLLVK